MHNTTLRVDVTGTTREGECISEIKQWKKGVFSGV